MARSGIIRHHLLVSLSFSITSFAFGMASFVRLTNSRRSLRIQVSKELRVRVSKFVFLGCVFATLPVFAGAQSLSPALVDAPSPGADTTIVTTRAPQIDSDYVRPSQSARLHDYFWEMFGPYSIGGALVVGGWNQLNDTVPQWHQGAAGYARRFGSDLGIASVRTTTRYALAEALHEDTLYYRCECTGFLPRTRHAVLSTLTGRRGADGHTVFSFSQLAAPYAGTMVAVYGWYPDRYNAKDAFRMGNYSLLAYMSGNIGLEFLHVGSGSFFTRFHLYNAHAAPGNSR
jgi:hypothetical protein